MSRNFLGSASAIAFAAVTLFATTLPASAAAPIVRHVKIEYSDLDLSTPAGRAVVKQRVATAARQACGPAENFKSPGYDNYQACYTAAIADVTLTVDRAVAAAQAKSEFAATP